MTALPLQGTHLLCGLAVICITGPTKRGLSSVVFLSKEDLSQPGVEYALRCDPMTTSDLAKRYLVVRVPSSGPKALAGAPNDFASLDAAEARLEEIVSGHLIAHHPYLEIVEYTGERSLFLKTEGILF